MIHRATARVLLLAALLLAAAGCGQKAVSFNNELAKLEKKVEGPTKALKGHFTSFMNKNTVDAAQAEADYEATVAAIDDVIAKAKAIKAPNVELAGEFKDAFVTFYEEQRSLVTVEIRQALDVLKDKSLKETEQAEKLKALEAAMAAKAAASSAKMQAAQQRYAAANEMKIEAPQ